MSFCIVSLPRPHDSVFPFLVPDPWRSHSACLSLTAFSLIQRLPRWISVPLCFSRRLRPLFLCVSPCLCSPVLFFCLRRPVSPVIWLSRSLWEALGSSSFSSLESCFPRAPFNLSAHGCEFGVLKNYPCGGVVGVGVGVGSCGFPFMAMSSLPLPFPLSLPRVGIRRFPSARIGDDHPACLLALGALSGPPRGRSNTSSGLCLANFIEVTDACNDACKDVSINGNGNQVCPGLSPGVLVFASPRHIGRGMFKNPCIVFQIGRRIIA